MAAHLIGQQQQLTPQQIIAQEDFMKLFDRGALPAEVEKDSLKRPLPAAFTQFDPTGKRPLSILPQMSTNMLTHQQLMQQAALQAAMQARTMPSTMQNSYMQAAPHLRPLESTNPQQIRAFDQAQSQLRPVESAQQIRQLNQNAAAAAAYGNAAAAAAAQQYRQHDHAAMAQQLQRQLPAQMLQSQAAMQMRSQQMTMEEYHNLLRLAQPAAAGALPQRRQSISGTNMSPQMPANVPRLQRTATTMAPTYSSALQFQHQMTAPLSSLQGKPISLATPIPLQQQNIFAQQFMSNAMRAAGAGMAPPPMPVASVGQPQAASTSSNSMPSSNPSCSSNVTGGGGGGGMEDAEFLAFLENVRQIEAHLTRTLAESIQRSTTTQQTQ